MNRKIHYLTETAMIAALYVLFTYISAVFGLASGAVQLRLSEALCILPLFTPAAVPGLFFGCVIANLLTNAVIWDVIFGSLATLIGAVVTRALRRHTHYLAPVPPILSNTLIVPAVIAYTTTGAITLSVYLPIAFTVFLGEVLSCGVVGLLLFGICQKYAPILFPNEEKPSKKKDK